MHTAGDNFARYWVRVQEMRESIKIIRQCEKLIEPGPVRPEHDDVPWLLRPPVGDAYAAIEHSKGELGFYLVSDGSISTVPLPRQSAIANQPDAVARDADW